MKEEGKEIILKNNESEIAKQLDNSVLSVLSSKQLQGFEKAYRVASAIGRLRELLTPEYMRPIMLLQGNKLGFLTDKDKKGGYTEDEVKDCVIEATLMGLEVTGNHFNILSGKMYPTKEGLGYLLNKFDGLKFTIICSLPQVNANRTGAAVDVKIRWKLFGGTEFEENIPVPIKMDAFTSVDAIIGKATRKGRAWLLSKISDVEITDGEIEDVKHTIVSTTVSATPVKTKEQKKEASEDERLLLMIDDCTTIEELEALKPNFKKLAHFNAYETKKANIKPE